MHYVKLIACIFHKYSGKSPSGYSEFNENESSRRGIACDDEDDDTHEGAGEEMGNEDEGEGEDSDEDEERRSELTDIDADIPSDYGEVNEWKEYENSLVQPDDEEVKKLALLEAAQWDKEDTKRIDCTKVCSDEDCHSIPG